MNLFEQRFIFIKPSRSASELGMLRQVSALRSFWHMPTRNRRMGNSRSYLKVRQIPVAWGTVTVYLPS
jgi:hypothetical protein